MNISGSTKIAGIVGNPIGHSLSPKIHNFLFARHNINAVYLPFPIKNESDLEGFLQTFRAANFLGCNITIPYKEAILKSVKNLCDGYEIIKYSEIIGAANTLYPNTDNTKLCATTTDFFGFSNSLIDNKFFINSEMRVVILGNGGVARTIAMFLASDLQISFQRPHTISIIGRNAQKLKELADEIKQKTDYSVSYFTFENAGDAINAADIIINCTSVGMHPKIDETPIDACLINPKTYIYDTIYNPLKTRFLREAEEKGCRAQNGLRMLIWQAIESFSLWTGIDLRSDAKVADELENLLLKEFDK